MHAGTASDQAYIEAARQLGRAVGRAEAAAYRSAFGLVSTALGLPAHAGTPPLPPRTAGKPQGANARQLPTGNVTPVCLSILSDTDRPWAENVALIVTDEVDQLWWRYISTHQVEAVPSRGQWLPTETVGTALSSFGMTHEVPDDCMIAGRPEWGIVFITRPMLVELPQTARYSDGKPRVWQGRSRAAVIVRDGVRGLIGRLA